MKLHHAAALALVGWALIFPPLVGDRVDIGAPVNEWEIMGKGFATVRDCEQSRTRVGWYGYANLTDMSDPKTRAKEEADAKAFFQRRTASRCVPDDDLRLKTK